MMPRSHDILGIQYRPPVETVTAMVGRAVRKRAA